MQVLNTIATGNAMNVKKIIYQGRVCAVKILKRSQETDRLILKEIKIHRSLSHQNITRFITDFGNQIQHYIIMDYGKYCLRNLIVPNIGMSPVVAHMLFVQLIAGVKYLHSRRICHRDIKPENILISNDGTVNITDFGHSTFFYYKEHRRLKSRAGTYSFMAPEIFDGSYDGELCDIWSCGITLVNMLSGELPWEVATSSDEVYQRFVRKGMGDIELFKEIRESTRGLIKKMLSKERDRCGLSGVISDGWFRQENSLLGENGRCIDSSFLLGIEETPIDLYYTQPDMIKGNKCFIGSSLPVNCADKPEIYRLHVGGKAEFIVVTIKEVLRSMVVQCEVLGQSIVFSTTDTKRNKLSGEIVVQELKDSCFVTIKKNKGDLLEFKKFVKYIRLNFCDNKEK
ncbi:serine/threonine-protein kinase CHEK1 [Pancytospora epiphaga]|nr:serine/threonine-protein kinase CHEK1 [Pancytospora epiphaga]